MSEKKVKFNQQDIDSYLITVVGMLLLGYVVLFQSYSSTSNLESYLLLISVISLTTSLFALIWKKHRFSVRDDLYKTETKKIINKYVYDIYNFITKVVGPLTKLEYKESKRKPSEREIQEKYGGVVEAFVLGIATERQNLFQRYYKKPLKEKNAKFKYLLDLFSLKVRYHFVIIGIVSFMFALVFRLTGSLELR